MIATGGSVVYCQEAMEHLKSVGTVVYLKLSLNELSKRLGNLKGRGVVLKEGQTLRELYDERCRLFEQYADVRINEDGLSMGETVEKVLAVLSDIRGEN